MVRTRSGVARRRGWRLAGLWLGLGAACGGNEAPVAGESEAPVVYGQDDRREYWDHPDPVLRARTLESAVALIRPARIDDRNPDDLVIDHRTLGEDEGLCPGERFFQQQVGASCSGTLVDWDLVLTAGHCVDNTADCRSKWFVFDHFYEAPDRLATISMQDVFQCRRLVTRLDVDGIDYAFVQLDRPVAPPRRPAPVDRVGLPLTEGSSVAVVGFPDGIPAKLDSGGVVLWDGRPDYEEFEATLDTFGGNSGSGVYDANRVLVGVLSRGETDYVQRDGCYVVNRLPETGDEGEAEGVSYVAHALSGLCATGWRTGLCGPDDGACRPCADASVCPEGWQCRGAATDPDIRWCAAPCAVDGDCPAAHACVNGACNPTTTRTCVGNQIWNLNACGREVDRVDTCVGPAQVCRNGGCVAADPGNSCEDALPLEAVDQVLTGSIGLGLTNELEGSCGGAGRDRIFEVRVPSATRLVATSVGYDSVLYLRGRCDSPPTERACSDDDDPPGMRGSRIDVMLSPGTHFLVLDAYGNSTGPYTLTLDFTDLAPPDAGTQPDSGAAPDAAALPDAAPADAGAAPADAGVTVDAGAASGDDDDGCGCHAGRARDFEGGLWAWLGLLGVAGLRRRRDR